MKSLKVTHPYIFMKIVSKYNVEFLILKSPPPPPPKPSCNCELNN